MIARKTLVWAAAVALVGLVGMGLAADRHRSSSELPRMTAEAAEPTTTTLTGPQSTDGTRLRAPNTDGRTREWLDRDAQRRADATTGAGRESNSVRGAHPNDGAATQKEPANTSTAEGSPPLARSATPTKAGARRASYGIVRGIGSDLVEFPAPEGEVGILVRDDAGAPVEGATVRIQFSPTPGVRPAEKGLLPLDTDLLTAKDGRVAGVARRDGLYTVYVKDVPPTYADRARDAFGSFGNWACIQFDSEEAGGKGVVLTVERTGRADLLVPRSLRGYGWRPMFAVKDKRDVWSYCPWNPSWKEDAGHLRIDRLPLGTVCVTVIVAGLGIGSRIIDVSPGIVVGDSLRFTEGTCSLTLGSTTFDGPADSPTGPAEDPIVDLETLVERPETAAEWHTNLALKGPGRREARFSGLAPGRYVVTLRPTDTQKATTTYGATFDVSPGENSIDLGPVPTPSPTDAPLRLDVEGGTPGPWSDFRALAAPASPERPTWQPVLLDRSKSVSVSPGDVIVTTWLRPPSRGPTRSWSEQRLVVPPAGTVVSVRVYP